MLIWRTRRRNLSSSSVLYTVCGIVILNLSLASALHPEDKKSTSQKATRPPLAPADERVLVETADFGRDAVPHNMSMALLFAV
jgi:hypothetical protein